MFASVALLEHRMCDDGRICWQPQSSKLLGPEMPLSALTWFEEDFGVDNVGANQWQKLRQRRLNRGTEDGDLRNEWSAMIRRRVYD
jgi:hypothetical protein